MARTKQPPKLKQIPQRENTSSPKSSPSNSYTTTNTETKSETNSETNSPRRESIRTRANLILQRRHQYDEHTIVPLLANRSTHLPGNTWYQDWIEWMKNNHILIGIYLHHPLHPIQWDKRIVAMIGSVSFGLSSTTIMYLWDVIDPERMRSTLFYLPMMDGDFVVTLGMVILWTLGGFAHSMFDLMVWYIMACACCHPGGCCYRDRSTQNINIDEENTTDDEKNMKSKSFREQFKHMGFYMILPVIVGLVAIMALSVLIRASIESRSGSDFDDDRGDNVNNMNDDESDSSSWIYPWRHVNIEGLEVESFSFLGEYVILLALSWFVYFPIAVTVMFSGILGCNGRLPVLGGRPRDKARVEKSLMSESDPSEIAVI